MRATHKELHSIPLSENARLSIDKWMHPELYLSFQSMLNERFVPSFKFLSDFSLSACLWTGRSPSMHSRPPDNRSLDPCTYCIFAMVCGYFIYFSFEFGCLLFVFGSGICCNALRSLLQIRSWSWKKSGFILWSRWFLEWKIIHIESSKRRF